MVGQGCRLPRRGHLLLVVTLALGVALFTSGWLDGLGLDTEARQQLRDEPGGLTLLSTRRGPGRPALERSAPLSPTFSAAEACAERAAVRETLLNMANEASCAGRPVVTPKVPMGGFGAQAHVFLHETLLGLVSGYRIQMAPNSSRFTSEAWCGASRDFLCYFAPLPTACDAQRAARRAARQAASGGARAHRPAERKAGLAAIELLVARAFNATSPRPGLFSVVNALARLVMQPNPRTQAALDAKWQRLRLDPSEGWVGLHLRQARAKVFLEGGTMLPEAEMLALVRRECARAQVRTVYVASDTVPAMTRLPGLLPELRVVYDEAAFPKRRQKHFETSSVDQGLLMVSELLTLAAGRTFIGTLSSNLGRLVVELMWAADCGSPQFVDIDGYLTPADLPAAWFLNKWFTHMDITSWRAPQPCVTRRCLKRAGPKKTRLNGTCPAAEMDVKLCP